MLAAAIAFLIKYGLGVLIFALICGLVTALFKSGETWLGWGMFIVMLVLTGILALNGVTFQFLMAPYTWQPILGCLIGGLTVLAR